MSNFIRLRYKIFEFGNSGSLILGCTNSCSFAYIRLLDNNLYIVCGFVIQMSGKRGGGSPHSAPQAPPSIPATLTEVPVTSSVSSVILPSSTITTVEPSVITTENLAAALGGVTSVASSAYVTATASLSSTGPLASSTPITTAAVQPVLAANVEKPPLDEVPYMPFFDGPSRSSDVRPKRRVVMARPDITKPHLAAPQRDLLNVNVDEEVIMFVVS